jgi:hypothetical protein
VWVVHQISGKANEKDTEANIEHTDAKGSKSWGTYFDVSFTVSKLHRETRKCSLQITKNRYGEVGQHIELTLLGEICTIEQTSVIAYEGKDGGMEKTATTRTTAHSQAKNPPQKLIIPD